MKLDTFRLYPKTNRIFYLPIICLILSCHLTECNATASLKEPETHLRSRLASPAFAPTTLETNETFHRRLIGPNATEKFVLPKCTQKNSTGLNECLQHVLQLLKPRLPKGIPELNFPAMEPLILENVAFEQGTGAVRVASTFTNVKIAGISDFKDPHFWVDVSNRTLDFDMIFPQLSLTGNYEMSGNLFFILIGGKGDFYLNLDGCRAKGVCELGVFKNSSTAQVIVKNTDVNLRIDNIKVHLTNLFNGDPILGTFMNQFLSENAHEIFDEIKPQVGVQVGELLSMLSNRALAALSTSLFDDPPLEIDLGGNIN